MALVIIFLLITKVYYVADNHVSHLEKTSDEELNRLLGIVVDVESMFICVRQEEDGDTKQVYFYLFKVSMRVY